MRSGTRSPSVDQLAVVQPGRLGASTARRGTVTGSPVATSMPELGHGDPAVDVGVDAQGARRRSTWS